MAESVQSANSSGHLFPVEIRQSQQAPAVFCVERGCWLMINGGYTSQYMSVCMSVYIYVCVCVVHIYIYTVYIFM